MRLDGARSKASTGHVSLTAGIVVQAPAREQASGPSGDQATHRRTSWGHRKYLTLWVAAIAILIATPAHAFTLEWPPSVTPVDGYDVEETTDNGVTFKVIGGVAPAQCLLALCSFTVPEPTTGRPQWRVVIKVGGWRVPSIGFYGVDKGLKPSFVAPPVPAAPLPIDAIQVKP